VGGQAAHPTGRAAGPDLASRRSVLRPIGWAYASSRKETDLDIRGFVTSLDISLTNAMFALGAAVVSFIVIHSLLAMFRKRLGEMSDERAQRPVAEVLRKTLASTSNLAVVATSILIGLSVLDLPPPWDERVRHLWFLTLGAQLALYLHRALAVTSRRYFKLHGHGTEDEQVTVAHTLIIWVLQTSVWIVFLLAMLSNLGINVTTFIASLGIGGIAIALAVQNVLGDLFASLSIAIDKPFEVGDSIATPEFFGAVEHVGLKTTRIRADSGEQVVIANAELLKKIVRNYKRMSSRRVVFTLRVNPHTPPALAARVPDALRAIVEKKEQVRFDRAHLKTLDQNWIEYEVVYYMQDPDYMLFMNNQQAIILEAMQMFIDMGISTLPAPQQLLLAPAGADDQEGADGGVTARPANPLRSLQRGS
jgi:small-conductance mechanosensitive channel